MKIKQIAILLLVQLMCCCGKAENGYIIPLPSKPDSGQQGGGSGSGGEGGGGEEGGGTETPPPVQPKDG